MDLKKQVAVITGASDGLGKSIALELAEKGCNVVIIGRDKNKLSQVKSDVIKFNVSCMDIVCDVSVPEDVNSAIEKVIATFDRLDILINNAGIWASGQLEAHSTEKIKSLFATNTLGTIYMTKSAIVHMKNQKQGQILNVMSIASVEAKDAYGIIYTATKHALKGFTDTLKDELQGTGIKVMGFYPGGMATNILKAAGIDMPNSKNLAMDTKDVARIISFVLSQPKDVVIDHFEVRKFSS